MEAVRKNENDNTFFYLSGDIGENTSFEMKFGEVKSRLELNCKGITQINSIGIRKWLQYFDSLRKSNVSLRFHECSMPIMDQTVLHSNFLHASEIESLLVPLFCSGCDSNSERIFTVHELKSCNFTISKINCTCGGQMELDVGEDYFDILRNS